MYGPLDQTQEKCFQISFNPHQHIIPDDLVLGHGSVEAHHDDKNFEKRRRKKKLRKNLDDLHGRTYEVSDQNHDQNKMMHRERERQRRQEMGTLFSTLRTLLPLEFIKGTRAISDQMNGAVNYIKHQKMRIKEMEVKRDELRKFYDSNGFEKSSGVAPSCSFKIYFSHGVLEIMIITSFDGFPLSKILKLVVEEGLNVVNCGSSQVNDKSIHTVQIEVSDSSFLDVSQLEKKLMEAVPMLRQITD